MQSLRCVPQVVVRLARRVIALIVLARRRQLRQVVVDAVARRVPRAAHLRGVGGVERQRGRPTERRAHQHDRSENIGPHDSAPRGDRRSEVVADDGGDRAIAERRDERDHVGHLVQRSPRTQVVVELHVRAARAPVPSQVRRDDVISGCRNRQHHLPPAVRELGETMNQQHGWSALAAEP